MIQVLLNVLVFVGILAAWVSGALDPYQKRLQEIVLDFMGETKVSYGLKKSLTSKQLIEDENFNKIQEALGDQLGGVFQKGGLGHSVGATLSKGL